MNRPTSHVQGGAVATINAFEADSLLGIGSRFNVTLFNTLIGLAEDADAASRQRWYARRDCATTTMYVKRTS